MSRAAAWWGVVLTVLGILGLDYFVLTSSATLSRYAEGELKKMLGDALEYSSVKFSLRDGLELRGAGLFVTKGRHKVLSADRLQVVLTTRDGEVVPERVVLERARFSFSDRLLDSIAAEPGKGSIADAIKPDQLPRIVVKGGAIEVAYAGILDVHSPQVFEIDEIQMVPVDGYRYFVGGRVKNALLGPWRVSGEVDLKTGAHEIQLAGEDVQLGPAVRDILSPRVHRDWDRYRPQGQAKVRLRLSRPEKGAVSLVATVVPVGIKMTYAGFPLPLREVHGEIDFTDHGFTVKHLTGRSGAEGRIWFDGAADGYESDSGYSFRIEVRSLTLDDTLRAAMGPTAQQVWDEFSPRGTVDAVGRAEKAHGAGQPLRNPMDVTFKNASFRYAKFPIDMEAVKGEIHVDGDTVVVKTLDGRHVNAEKRTDGKEDVAEIHASGILLNLGTDPEIDLYLRGQNLAFDILLKQALVPKLKTLWDEFLPSGAFDFDWHLTKAPSKDEEHRGTITARNARVIYKITPLPVSGITGEVNISPGRFELHNLKGALDHGTVDCNGVVTDDAQGFVVDLKFDVHDGRIDDRFKNAMPPAVAAVLNSLKFSGEADYHFAMTMRDPPGKTRQTNYALWLNVSKGVIDAKVRVDEIEGAVVLAGDFRNGGPEASGSLHFRQARLMGKKVTDVTGRYLVQGNSVTFSTLRGRTYGGDISGTLSMNTETTSYEGEFTVDRLELRDFVRDTKKYSDRNLSGKVELSIRMSGLGSDSNTMKGFGSMIITEGQLMEVPGIVSFMSGSWGGRFKACRVDYVIREGKFRVEGSNVLAMEGGDGGAVYGQGWVDFDTNYSFKVTSDTAPLFGIDFWLFKIPSKLFDLAKSPFKKRVRGRLSTDEAETITDPEKIKDPDE